MKEDYKFKIKLVIRQECENRNDIIALTEKVLSQMIPLGDNIYATDDLDIGADTAMTLANINIIRSNAKELMWRKWIEEEEKYYVEDLKNAWLRWTELDEDINSLLGYNEMGKDLTDENKKQYENYVKVILKKNCDDINEVMTDMVRALDDLVPLGDGYYGTNDHTSGIASAMAVAARPSIYRNAEEIVWISGYDFDPETGRYDYFICEDMIEGNKRWDEREKKNSRKAGTGKRKKK